MITQKERRKQGDAREGEKETLTSAELRKLKGSLGREFRSRCYTWCQSGFPSTPTPVYPVQSVMHSICKLHDHVPFNSEQNPTVSLFWKRLATNSYILPRFANRRRENITETQRQTTFKYLEFILLKYILVSEYRLWEA